MLEIYTIVLLVMCGALAFFMVKLAQTIKIQDIRIDSLQSEVDSVRTTLFLKEMEKSYDKKILVPEISILKRKRGRPKKEKSP